MKSVSIPIVQQLSLSPFNLSKKTQQMPILMMMAMTAAFLAPAEAQIWQAPYGQTVVRSHRLGGNFAYSIEQHQQPGWLSPSPALISPALPHQPAVSYQPYVASGGAYYHPAGPSYYYPYQPAGVVPYPAAHHPLVGQYQPAPANDQPGIDDSSDDAIVVEASA